MTKRSRFHCSVPAFAVLCLLFTVGCAPRKSGPAPDPRVQARQAREQEVQRQILERRTNARKASRTHTAH